MESEIKTSADDMIDTPAAASLLIKRFGGIRPMAGKLDVPVTTVQGWKKRGAIPVTRHAEIIAAAARYDIDLDDLGQAFVSDTPDTSGEPAAKPYATLATPPLGKGGLNTLWLALSASVFIMLAVMLAFAGFYLVKQKTGKLEQRVIALEHANAAAPGLEARLAALEASAHTAPPADTAHLQDIDKRLAELGGEAAQVSQLARQVGDLQATNGNHDLLTQSLTTMQGTVQGLGQEVETVRDKVAQLSTQVSERRLESAHQFALLLAVGQLRAAAMTAQPFDTELAAARSLAHNDADFSPDLEVLDNYAGDGAPTMNDLRLEFADLATEIVRSNVVGSGKSWFRQALYRLGSVITVRKINSKSHDNTAEVLVSRAETKLEEDNLAGAVEVLGGLTGLPKDVASAWVEAANRRLAVDAALSHLSSTLVERAEALGAPGNPP